MREGTLEWYKKIFSEILKDDMTQYQNQIDSWQLLLNMKQDLGFEDKEIRDYAMKISQYTHKMADYVAGQTGSGKFNDLYYKLLLLEAQNYQVDSGLLYLEKNRVPKERFYEPRREVFIKHQIIQSLQDLMDDKLDIFALSVPPGCGKSTLEDFFLSLVGGWFPNDFNLSSAHSSILTRSLYDGVLEIINDPVEYTWHEIFPNVKLTGTNAKETTVNLERNGRFKTWTFRSIDGSLTGATRCNRFLTADDLVSGIEEALNKSRLETLWTKVVNDLRSRRLEGCKEIYIATRWSVHDPIGKLQQLYEGNPKARFIIMPERTPDAIWAVCDTKDTGADFESLPIAYQFGEDFFIPDVVFDDTTDYDTLDMKSANILIRHNPHKIRFESNSAGGRVAHNVQKLIDGKCRAQIEPERTQANKETKILVNSDWIKKHCIFLDPSLYTPKSDYGLFMENVVTYTVKVKPPHDDGPDSLAMLAEYVARPVQKPTTIINSPI